MLRARLRFSSAVVTHQVHTQVYIPPDRFFWISTTGERQIYEFNSEADSNVVDVYIGYLRSSTAYSADFSQTAIHYGLSILRRQHGPGRAVKRNSYDPAAGYDRFAEGMVELMLKILLS
jgi:hypothetical protein